MKTLILIDKSTIKRHEPPLPPMRMTGKLMIEPGAGIPLCIDSDIELTGMRGSNYETEMDFYVPEKTHFRRFLTLIRHLRKPRMVINLTSDFFDYTCKDNNGAFSMGMEPTYSYDRENTPVQCTNCGEFTGYNEINQLPVFNGDGEEIEVDICPKCGNPETFEYDFQRIEEVL